MRFEMFIIVLCLFFATNIKAQGFDVGRKTPRKGGVYPVFTEKDYIRGTLNDKRSCYDVLHYTIDIDVNPGKKHIKGFVDIEFSAVRDFADIQIDLYENMQIDSIVCNTVNLSYSRKFNAVYVHFTDTVRQGETKTIRCSYSGKPTKAKLPPWNGGFVWKTSKGGKPWFGVTCEKVGASLWYPCKDHLSDEPDNGATVRISVPKGLKVVGNGVLTAHNSLPYKEQFTWNTVYPINNYNITFYAGNFVSYSEEFQGLDTIFNLQYYVLPEYLEESRKAFTQTALILHFFENTFGAYPWTNACRNYNRF